MAFVKQGVGNVNLSTGAATARIPLYEIKIKDFTFPIYLAYSTQGLKADEASSRMGLGWVLNANAVITRSVRGEPDEFSQRLSAPPDLTVQNSALSDFLTNATLPVGSGNDTQPDEFQFNVNGYSGKFVLDDNLIPRITSTSNVKINLTISRTPLSTSGYIGPIVLTTPDGIKYTFSIYEKTTAINMKRYSPYYNTTVTAFYLNRIDLPTGEYVTFAYTSINTTVETGKAQQLIAQQSQGAGVGNCMTCGTATTFTTTTDKISYSTYFLNNITTSSGIVVNLTYQARLDLSGDNRLTSLEVTGLKKYTFEYYDVAGQSTRTTGRFFLTKVKDAVITGSTGDAGLDYTLAYNSMTSVPLPLLAGQDVLGFYNGNTNTDLLPATLNSQGQFDISFRDPNPSKAIYGTLASISYPTGGKEEITYEANTKSATRVVNSSSELISLFGVGAQVYTRSTIFCRVNQTISIQTQADDAILNDGYTAGANLVTVVMRLYDGITQVATGNVLGYSANVVSYNLLANHTYRLEMQVKYATENGTCSFLFDNGTPPVYEDYNTTIPGLRVSRIKFTDPINANNFSKYFTYASLSNVSKSTGSALLPVFASTKIDRTYCGSLGQDYTTCLRTLYSSSSTGSVYEMAGTGSVIYYTNVIESNSPNFLFGGTEHEFFVNNGGQQATKLVGTDIPYMPSGQYPTLSGMEKKSRVFDSKRTVVSEEENVYETITDQSTATNSYYYRKQFDAAYGNPYWIEAYDVYKMTYNNTWIRLKDKISRSFVPGNQLVTTSTYKYGTATNILPDSIISQDSKGLALLTTLKYPTSSFAGDPDALNASNGYSTLVSKNIITPVVQKTEYRNNVVTKKVRTYYSDFLATVPISPSAVLVKSSTGDVLDNEIIFSYYDTKGNLREVKKSADVQNTYIWDKEKSLVLAKVIGEAVTSDKVAYTGFEVSGDYGNWTYSSGSVGSTVSYTGLKCFTGTLTKSMTSTGTYVVSLWTNTSATVNAAAGSLIRTVRGWKLYRWSLTNPTTITVTGTNIDELRLIPSGAQLVSFTHKAFVGLLAKLDENEVATYYDYDYRNRLSVIKDENWSILKKYDYGFAGVVTPLASYANDEISGDFLKSNCDAGTTPVATTYVIPAGSYFSTISQADANQQATAALNAGGPAYANTNGTCVPMQCTDCTSADRKCINNVCEMGGFKYTSSTYQQVSIAGAIQWRYVVTVKYCFSDGTTSTYSWQEAKTTSPTLNTCILP